MGANISPALTGANEFGGYVRATFGADAATTTYGWQIEPIWTANTATHYGLEVNQPGGAYTAATVKMLHIGASTKSSSANYGIYIDAPTNAGGSTTNIGLYNAGTTTLNDAVTLNTSLTTPAIKITTGAADGYYLKSDADGDATWTAVSAGQVYKGTWLASTNTPTLADGTGTAGWYYRVVDAGTVDMDPGVPVRNLTFAAGDDVSYNGSLWEKIPGVGYTLQVATASVLGGIKVGGSLQINSEVLNVNNYDMGDVTVSGTGTDTGRLWAVDAVGGSTAANVHAAELLANAATDANTASTIVKRDGSGNFSAGTITAALTGVASGNATSVGLQMPAQFSVANSPVTGAATLLVAWETEAANTVLAGPVTGIPAVPTFRSIREDDIQSRGTTTTVLHGNASGGASFASVTASDFGTQTATYALIGPVSGGAATPTFRALTATDIPALAYALTGAVGSSGLTMNTARMLGRTTASAGAIEEIQISTGLSLSAGVLTATGSGGTVTSVGLSMPAQFAVVNSPVTGAATLLVSWEAQAANTVFAGPTTGIPAVPAFRALKADDLQNTGTTTTVLHGNASGATSFSAVVGADFGSQTAKYFLAAPNASDGNPSFRAIAASDVPTLNQNTTGNAATATALAANGTNCSAGNYPLGVDASGNAESCTAVSGAYWGFGSNTVYPTSTGYQVAIGKTAATAGVMLDVTGGEVQIITTTGQHALYAQTSTTTGSTYAVKGLHGGVVAGSSYGGYFTATGNGTGSRNVGVYASATGGLSSNHAAIFENGNVGIGITVPTATQLHVTDGAAQPSDDSLLGGTYLAKKNIIAGGEIGGAPTSTLWAKMYVTPATPTTYPASGQVIARTAIMGMVNSTANNIRTAPIQLTDAVGIWGYARIGDGITANANVQNGFANAGVFDSWIDCHSGACADGFLIAVAAEIRNNGTAVSTLGETGKQKYGIWVINDTSDATFGTVNTGTAAIYSPPRVQTNAMWYYGLVLNDVATCFICLDLPRGTATAVGIDFRATNDTYGTWGTAIALPKNAVIAGRDSAATQIAAFSIDSTASVNTVKVGWTSAPASGGRSIIYGEGTPTIYVKAGYVGVGAVDPAVPLDIYTASGDSQIRVKSGSADIRVGANSAGSTYFKTESNHPQIFYTNATERMRIAADGTITLAALTTQGFVCTTAAGVLSASASTCTGATVSLATNASGLTGTPNISVGTISSGNITLTGYLYFPGAAGYITRPAGTTQDMIIYNGNGNMVYQVDSGTMAFNTGGANNRITISNTGAVNVVSLGTLGYVCTTAAGLLSAGGASCSSSDARLKKNIVNITSSSALDAVDSMRGVYFDWINQKEYGSAHQIGMIAQEVEQVIPEVVSTHSDGMKAIAYDKLVPLLLEAIKELKVRLETAEKKLSINN